MAPNMPESLQLVQKTLKHFGANSVQLWGPDALWWLLALSPGEWTKIVIPSKTYQLYASWFSPLWKLSSSDVEVPVGLHLGTMTKTQVIPSVSIQGPILYWFKGNRRQLLGLQVSGSCQKVHVKHTDLGGGIWGLVTSFCIVGLDHRVALQVNGLKQTLCHAIDFSLPGCNPLQDTYSYLDLDQTVPMGALELDVVVPSFGGSLRSRPLAIHEKAALFNFPGWLSGSLLHSCFELAPPPLLGFTWVLEGVVSHLPGKVSLSSLSPADTELLRDAGAGMQVLGHYMDASWWKWHRGSWLHFWRWPNRLGRQSACNGFPVFISKALPRHPSKQRPPPKELTEVGCRKGV